ncbi:MAG: hypothetical protein JWM53_2421 [bacterium]|nr:hypothetical protein [bacterium]
MALSTVGLLGLIALQSIAIRGNMMSRNFGEAIGIAQQRLEIVQRTPYANLPNTATIPLQPIEPCSTNAATPCAQGTPASPDPNSTTQAIYTRCTTVTDNTSVDNTTTVLVRVCWPDLDSSVNPHHVDLIARRSP